MYKKVLFIVILVLSLTGCTVQNKTEETAVIGDMAAVKEETAAETVSAQINDGQNLLNEQQKELLRDFAMCYANTLKDMQYADISQLFAEAEGEESYVNRTAYTTLTQIRGMQEKDLSLEYARVMYSIDSVYQNGNSVIVELTEDNIQKFKHLQQESCTYNIYHCFELTETAEGWKIESHLHEEDFFLLAVEAWEDAKGADYAERSANAIKLLKADAEENFVLAAENLNEFRAVNVTKEYDREKAVQYAQQWCNKRNSEYLEYDLYGGNCQNFASQCVHAGGMDMDIKGNYTCQWKFYGKDLNYSQTANGRSYSWIGVDEFYSYAVYNSGNGLALQPDVSLEYAQKGDIIQVGAYGRWRHSLVVTDVLINENGNAEEIILASNTADRWNYPLSAYIYTYPRLIHIDGQI